MAHGGQKVHSGPWTRVLIVLIVAAVVALLAIYKPLRTLHREGLLELSELGMLAPVYLVAAYSVMGSLLLPVFPLDLAAGAHFGFLWGVLWVQVAATVASVCSFQLSRHVFRGFVQRRMKSRPVFRAIEHAVAEDGWRLVFLTRLSPILSFSIQGWLYGVTSVSFPMYVGATFVGVLPGTALYVGAGTMAREVSGVPGSGQPGLEWAIEITAFVVSTALIVYVTRKAQRTLTAKLALEESPAPGG